MVRSVIKDIVSSVVHDFGGGGAAKPDGAPYNLALTVDSDTQISGTFLSTSTNQDGYEVAISTDGTTYTLKTTVTDLSFAATGLTSASLYLIKIRAYKGTQYSDYCIPAKQITYPTSYADTNTLGWHRIDDLSTITKDGSDLVSRWNDKLGSGRDLLVIDTGYNPTYAATGMQFRGAQGLRASYTWPQPGVIYMLVKINTWTYGHYICDSGASNNGFAIKTQETTPGIRLNSGGILITGQVTCSLSAYHVVRARLSLTAENDKIQVDNDAALIGSAGSGIPGGFTLGCRYDKYGATNIDVLEVMLRKDEDETKEANIYQYFNLRKAFFLT